MKSTVLPNLVLLVAFSELVSCLPASPPSSLPKTNTACSLQQTEAGIVADCSYRGLERVPSDLPSNLVSLNLCGNGLTELTNTTFAPYTALRFLDLCDNRDLSRIESHTFYPLVHLQELGLQKVRSLSWPTIFNKFQSFQNRSLTTVKLEEAHYINRGMETPENNIITANMTRYLANVCVESLNLRHNYIIYADLTPLFQGPFQLCIKYFDLSHNRYEGMVQFFGSLSNFKNLQHIDLSLDARASVLSRAHINNADPFNKNVTHITDTKFSYTIHFPKHLEYINLKHLDVLIEFLYTVRIHAPALKTFIASSSGFSMFLHPIRGLDNVEHLDWSSCDWSLVAPEFLDTFPALVHLNVSRTFLNQQFLLDWGKRLLQPLTRLQEVDMSDNDLSQLAGNTFPPTVRRLYLSNNHFSAVPVDVSRLPQLEELDLSFNAINILDQNQTAALDRIVSQGRNLTLHLYGNPLVCDCSALDFLMWLQTTSVLVDRYRDLPCLTEAKTYSTIGQVLAESNERLWRRCTARFWLAISGVGLLVLTLVLVLVWLGSKFRTQVQHVLLRLLGVGGTGRRRDDFRYDAYLAHSDSDEDVALAYGPLRRLLEERGGVRLFLRERELLPAVLPGASRAEGIVEGVHACWRTLVLLTPLFLQDEWCDFTTAVAVRTLDWRTPGRVLLLLAAPLSKADIPQTLLSAVEEEDVFLIYNRGDDHPVWDRLVNRILGRNMG